MRDPRPVNACAVERERPILSSDHIVGTPAGTPDLLGRADVLLAPPHPASAVRLQSVEATPVLVTHPSLKAVIGRLLVSLWVGCAAPALLFSLTLLVLDIVAAIVAALAWTLAASGWRWVTGRPVSGLLVLTAAIMAVRTGIALSTGSTFVYFMQPVAMNVVVAVAFLLSLATARPVVARMAGDFYPMTGDIAKRPRVRRLFWRLTLLWAVVCLAKGAITFWMLESQSLVDFVVIKSVAIVSLTVVSVAVTVWASVLVARKEGLLAAG
jgi:intracellular septation protein A